MNGPVKVLLLAGLLAGMAGCHTPKHSNVLVFATNTRGGIDIAYDPKMQEPSLLVGYKRQEGVWMPLLANMGPEGLTPGVCSCPCVRPCCQAKTPTEAIKCPAKNCVAAGHLYVGVDGNQTDTYSVLATFGAKWGAKGSSTKGAEAEGGLAQIFATGLSARKLAQVAGERLVGVQPTDAVAAEAAYAALTDPNLLEMQAKLDSLLKAQLKAGTKVGDREYKPEQMRDYADDVAEKIGNTVKTIRRKGGKDLAELVKALEAVKAP